MPYFIALYQEQKFDVEKSPKTFAYVVGRDTLTRRCNRCGSVVLRSDIDGYLYQCMNCDEDLYGIETHDGEPHTTDEFNELCCMTRDLLLLDN